MRILALSLVAALSWGAADAAKPDYLAIAAERFHGALKPLLEHRRSLGHTVALVSLESIVAEKEDPAASIHRHVKKVYRQSDKRLRFLLLVGDAGTVRGEKGTGPYLPAKGMTRRHALKIGFYVSPTFSSDVYYGTIDDVSRPQIAVGRLPADTVDELDVMVKNIIGYETSLDFGPWRKKITIAAGTGGFGALADSMLENMFRMLLADVLDAAYDLKVLYASPTSAYFYPPPSFSEKVVDLINEGSLVTAFVGHGSPTHCQGPNWAGRWHSALAAGDAEKIAVAHGSPIIAIIACSTGQFDYPLADCLAEQFMKRPKGPVAVYAATHVDHPYSNTLVSRQLILGLLNETPATLGEAILAEKHTLITHTID